MTLQKLPRKIRDRIKVDPSGCWLWTGKPMWHGYGQLQVNGQHWVAHRYVAHLLGYPLGENMHHRETCPKLCVNPEHLTPLTIAEHAAHHSTKELCVHGHPLADAYIVTRANGKTHRHCRYCEEERGKRRRAGETPEQRRADNLKRTERRRAQRARERA